MLHDILSCMRQLRADWGQLHIDDYGTHVVVSDRDAKQRETEPCRVYRARELLSALLAAAKSETLLGTHNSQAHTSSDEPPNTDEGR
jgi:hypothetical protein